MFRDHRPGSYNIIRTGIILMLISSTVQLAPFEIPIVNDIFVGEAVGGKIWTDETDSDFNQGTLDKVKVQNTGKNGNITLDKTYWSCISPSEVEHPIAERGAELSFIYGTDKIILFGGYRSSKNYDETWIYDLSENIFIKLDPETKPGARSGHSMAPIYGTDKVLLYGGTNYDNRTWIYDLSESSWIDMRPPDGHPDYRISHAMASIYGDDKVLLYGGYVPADNDDTWVYDLSDNKWTKKMPAANPGVRWAHRMATVDCDDRVVLFGGTDTVELMNDTWIYDLSEDNWTLMTCDPAPAARNSHGMVMLHGQDKILLFGGTRGTWPHFNDTWEYDVGDNTWTERSPQNRPSGRYSFGMSSFWGSDRTLIYGGVIDSPGKDQESWMYDHSDNNWTLQDHSDQSPISLSGHRLASIYNDDRLIMFGGFDGDVYIDQTREYDQSRNKWYIKMQM